MRIGLSCGPLLALGPGRRHGLWMQGCSAACPGCMAPSLADPAGGVERDAGELAVEIAAICREKECPGVTISGGEPFEQAEELEIFLKTLAGFGIADILLYTGRDCSLLLGKYPWIASYCACVVDGPFRRDLPDETAWRGSANQKAWLFRALPGYAAWLREKKGRLQTVVAGNKVYMLGIPRIGDAEYLLGVK